MVRFTSGYAYVANKRKLKHYREDNCFQCPGQKQCVDIYDQACSSSRALKTVFPCGKHPDLEGLV